MNRLNDVRVREWDYRTIIGRLLKLRERRERVADIAFVAILILVGWLLYDPLLERPTDYVDFPANIRAIGEYSGVADQFRGMLSAYGLHGRWNPIAFALFVVQWNLFESWMAGWYVVRFVIMSGIIALSFSLARRLQLNRAGAVCAALFFVVSPPASSGWMRLTAAEPVVTLFLVSACHFALSQNRRTRAWGMAAMLLCVLWTKEATTPAFVFPVLLAVWSPSRENMARRFDRGSILTLAPSAIVFLLAGIPIARTYMASSSTAFVSQYGDGRLTAVDLLASTLSGILPFAPEKGAMPVMVAFLAQVMAGSFIAFAPFRKRHQNVVPLMVCAFLVPLIGAITYAPWHFFTLVYALPFMVAGSVITAISVSTLWGAGRLGRAIAVSTGTVVFSYAIAQANNASGRLDAVRAAFAGTVQSVADWDGVDTVLVAVAPSQYRPGGTLSPLLQAYANMERRHWPPSRDATCEGASRPHRRALLVFMSVMCPVPTTADETLVFRYTRFSWPDPRRHADSVVVAFSRLP